MTGLDSFTDPDKIGALYPFRGFEVVLVIIAVVLWLAWHVVQVRKENKEYRDALHLYRQVGMERTLHFGGGAHVATQEDIEVVETPTDGAVRATTASEEEPGPRPEPD